MTFQNDPITLFAVVFMVFFLHASVLSGNHFRDSDQARDGRGAASCEEHAEKDGDQEG